jgi:urate oxidase/2-oxo-4-hydroxy-4-carboxy-5-ureidoimidazoline decarboxylase
VKASHCYGKAAVRFYRTRHPDGTRSLLAGELDLRVSGDLLLRSYTDRDNRTLVATDTLKNVMLETVASFEGTRLEQLLVGVGEAVLDAYPQIQWAELTGRWAPLEAETVTEDGRRAVSDVLFAPTANGRTMASVRLDRDGDSVRLIELTSGRHGIRLAKTTGSSFTGFVRDSHTTLPEAQDRPLAISLDVSWLYCDPCSVVTNDSREYVDAADMLDVICSTFHSFNSCSIQDLVHEISQRALRRFPSVAEVQFSAENHTWEPVSVATGEASLFCEPRGPYGVIAFALTRD